MVINEHERCICLKCHSTQVGMTGEIQGFVFLCTKHLSLIEECLGFVLCFPLPPFLQKGSSLVAPVHIVSEESADKTNLGFIHAFVAAISVIIVSELGDKTFFIAAIMAMRYNRLTVLAGAMLALGLMTCLSGWHAAFSALFYPL